MNYTKRKFGSDYNLDIDVPKNYKKTRSVCKINNNFDNNFDNNYNKPNNQNYENYVSIDQSNYFCEYTNQNDFELENIGKNMSRNKKL